MIELKNVYLRYTKDFNVLQDVSFRIKMGEKAVLYGTEASGKSSLLRTIVGIETPLKGEVYIKGIPANKVDYKNQVALGFLPSHPAFMENKTLLKNLEYPLKIRKVNKNLQNVKINNVLVSYGLTALKDVKVKDLSYFDRIKLCLARFALRNIEVFVIDDVFKSLNDGESKKIAEYINDLIMVNNATAIVAVSNENLVKKIGGKKLTIDNGCVTELWLKKHWLKK